MSIPAWLQHHLESLGRWNADGVSRRARSLPCPTCRAWIIVGLDDDRCALAASVDVSPLSALGEALALLAGRRTYSLLLSRVELDYRDADRIRGAPAGEDPRCTIHAAHECHNPPVATLDQPPALHRPRGASDDRPPF